MSEETNNFSEGGEAIAKAVHGLRDIGAGTDENVDVRSQDHNGEEIRLHDEAEPKPTTFEAEKAKPRDKYDLYAEELREEFRKLNDAERY